MTELRKLVEPALKPGDALVAALARLKQSAPMQRNTQPLDLVKAALDKPFLTFTRKEST